MTAAAQSQGRDPSSSPVGGAQPAGRCSCLVPHCGGEVRTQQGPAPPPSLVALGKLCCGLVVRHRGQGAVPSSLAAGHHLAYGLPARAADSLDCHPQRLQAAGQGPAPAACPGAPALFSESARRGGPQGLLPDSSHAPHLQATELRAGGTQGCSVALAAASGTV